MIDFFGFASLNFRKEEYKKASYKILSEPDYVSEVLKFNDENKRKQVELQKSAASESATKSTKKSFNSAANKDSNAAASGTSRKGGKTASLAGSSCSSTAGGDNLDLPASRPGTPDSIKSEVSTASSKNAGASENKSQKSKSSSRGTFCSSIRCQ